ncbi:TBC1 domain, member 5 [Chytriomyces hyalinus]|nr:TBC1 domain, member 5 [Chytriomyces hyalinus]
MSERLWDSFFPHQLQSIKDLREVGCAGDIWEMRSLYWKLYLEVLPSLETSAWLPILENERMKYSRLKQQFILDPTHESRTSADLVHNNPLSLDNDSPWQQYFQDSELTKLIRQDVDRTMPDQEFFRSNLVQDTMTHILFVWSKLNPTISYRQGMHELLAPVLYAVDSDKCAPSNSKSVREKVFDVSFVEHDTFALFERIMRTAKVWFEVNGEAKSGMDLKHRGTEAKTDRVPIIAKCVHVQDTIIQVLDVELWQHLTDIRLEPQLYGLRWIRLLFGREFSFHELLVLWDGIFADSLELTLVDWICASMLLLLRENILQTLMKYPSLESLQSNISSLIQNALHLRITYEQKLLRGSKSSKSDIKTNRTLALKYLDQKPSVVTASKDSLDGGTGHRSLTALMQSQAELKLKEHQDADRVLAKKMDSCIQLLLNISANPESLLMRRNELDGVIDELAVVKSVLESRSMQVFSVDDSDAHLNSEVSRKLVSSKSAASVLHEPTSRNSQKDAASASKSIPDSFLDAVSSVAQEVDLKKTAEAASKTVKAATDFFTGLFDERGSFGSFGFSSTSNRQEVTVNQFDDDDVVHVETGK